MWPMGYALEAFIAAEPVLAAGCGDFRALRVVPLAHGLALVPFTGALHDELAERAGELGRRLARPFAELWKPSPAAAPWGEHLSREGPVAYVEAVFAGGHG